MAIRSIEINRRHDQVRSNAHDTLEIGRLCGGTVNRPCARLEDPAVLVSLMRMIPHAGFVA